MSAILERPAAAELCVMLDCGALVCALPTRAVERLVLSEEAELGGDPHPRPAAGRASAASSAKVTPMDGSRMVSVAEKDFVAWDLGELLGLGPSEGRAWALLSVRHESGSLPIALRTGACLVVAPVGHTIPLPRGMFRDRAAAFSGAFELGSHRRTASAVIGLLLEPDRLFSRRELSVAAATHARERARA